MSNAIIYFGAPPSKDEIVSDDVKELGLNLLRVAPCALDIVCSSTVFQPNYSIYRDNLPLFLDSAIHGTYIKPSQSKFRMLDYSGETIEFPYPPLLVTFPVTLPEEARDHLRNRDINKVGCQLVPLPLSCRHLDDVFADRTLWNPHGNLTVPTSTSNLYKVFDGESMQMILSAFRGAMKITVSTGVSGGNKKRKADEEVGGNVKRRNARDL